MWKKLEAWFERYGRYRAAKTVIYVLSNMSDRELKDIGITRGQIREYAYTGSTQSS